MPRLKFAVGLFLALAAPAAAGPREAANALFSDPVEREAFFAMMAADPALTAAVAEAEVSAREKAGADEKAAAAGLQAAPQAAAWRQGVVDSLKKTRAALAAGLKLNPPQTEYPSAPLVAPLVQSLHKQNAADLFVSLNVPKYDGPAAPAATNPAPCPAGTSRSKALDQAKMAAAMGDMAPVTGDCHPTPPASIPNAPSNPPPPDPSKIPTPPAANAPSLSDQRTTTGAPPSPGRDEEGTKGGGFFDSLPWDKIKGGAGIGAAVGMILAFGTPLGLIGGALAGAAVGAVLFSGVIGNLFGGGKKSDS